MSHILNGQIPQRVSCITPVSFTTILRQATANIEVIIAVKTSVKSNSKKTPFIPVSLYVCLIFFIIALISKYWFIDGSHCG